MSIHEILGSFPLVYTKNRDDDKPRVSRYVYDAETGDVINRESCSCGNLAQAIEILNECRELDRTMFEALTERPVNALVGTRNHMESNKYSYCITIWSREGKRTVECGIDNIKNYAAEVFCIERGSFITQQ